MDNTLYRIMFRKYNDSILAKHLVPTIASIYNATEKDDLAGGGSVTEDWAPSSSSSPTPISRNYPSPFRISGPGPFFNPNISSSWSHEDFLKTYFKDQKHPSVSSIHESLFYQHVFNFTLVLIFFLQVLLVWTFLYRRRRNELQQDLEAGGGRGGHDMDNLNQIIINNHRLLGGGQGVQLRPEIAILLQGDNDNGIDSGPAPAA